MTKSNPTRRPRKWGPVLKAVFLLAVSLKLAAAVVATSGPLVAVFCAIVVLAAVVNLLVSFLTLSSP